jgi:hypothetical protein
MLGLNSASKFVISKINFSAGMNNDIRIAYSRIGCALELVSINIAMCEG